jgi:hypothetical protein
VWTNPPNRKIWDGMPGLTLDVGLSPSDVHFPGCGRILEKLPTLYPQTKHIFSLFYISTKHNTTPHIWGYASEGEQALFWTSPQGEAFIHK